ncbi:MAG: winged helix-turn-helix domain-containing protein [DPANN group archaeon]|nr:winged helix-turn-helix domain-containing protein [DPANN group archaeon]
MTRENRLDLAILQLFLRNTYLRLSINEIARRLGRQYPNINRKVNELLQEDILLKQVIGRSHLCSLNLDNPRTRLLMGLIELRRLEQEQPKEAKALRERVRELRRHHPINFALLKGREIFLCIQRNTPRKGPRSLAADGAWQIRSIPSADMSRHLLEHSLFADHHLIYGFDRYYEFINDHEQELRPELDPLLNPDGQQP